MTDEELIARLRDAPADGLGTENLCLEAADRIEALNEQLSAAQDDAKEAEDYAEELEADRKKTYEALLKVSRIHGEVEAKLATCEKYRNAYDEMGRIGTQAVRDLEAKLAKAADVIDWALSAWDDHNKHGDNMQGDWVHDARTTLAELKGDKT